MSRIEDLMANLAELEGLPSRITSPVAARLTGELKKEFLTGTDSYGKPWRKLAPYTILKKGHDTILVEKDNLANETRAVPLGGSGIALISTPIGGIHQSGTPDGRPPRRPVLPDGDDLPEAWQDIIEEETQKAFKKAMKR